MPSLAEALQTLHQVLLALFVGTTLLLMLATFINRLRIRRILFTWCAGRLFGLPIAPTLFLLVVAPLLVYSLTTGDHRLYTHPLLLSGYMAGGLFWYIAALLSNSVIVTDYGIIRNVNRIGQAVAWGQMVDYFCCDAKAPGRYVFFYMDKQNEKKRLAITVPRAHQDRFRQLVETKLDARFNFSMEQTYGKTALNS